MDKKETVKRIIYILKEMEDTRHRLQNNSNEAFLDIEISLLKQQVLNLYQTLAGYEQPTAKAGNIAAAKKAEPAIQRPEPVAKEETAPAKPHVPHEKEEDVKIDMEAIERRREKLQKLAEEAEQKEVTREKPAPEVKKAPEPAPVREEQPEPSAEAPKPVQEEKPAAVPYTPPAPAGEVKKPEPVAEEIKKAEPVSEKAPEPEPVAETRTEEPAPEKQGEEKQAAPVADIYTRAREPQMKKEEKLSLNERLQNQQSSLNERFAQLNVKKNLADKLKLSPIHDLKAAMTLNQRIAFQNKLFGGDDKVFKNVLGSINGFSNFTEAKTYLQSEIAPKHHWNDEDPQVQEFLELVYRKFL